MTAAHFDQRLLDAVARRAGGLQSARRRAAFVNRRQQQVLDRNVIVLKLLRLVFGGDEDFVQARRDVDLIDRPRRAANFRQAIHIAFNSSAQWLDVDAGARQHRRHQSALLFE